MHGLSIMYGQAGCGRNQVAPPIQLVDVLMDEDPLAVAANNLVLDSSGGAGRQAQLDKWLNVVGVVWNRLGAENLRVLVALEDHDADVYRQDAHFVRI